MRLLSLSEASIQKRTSRLSSRRLEPAREPTGFCDPCRASFFDSPPVLGCLHEESSHPASIRAACELLTCFDHNSSRSTNFLAIEVVPNAARRDLFIGAERKKFPADFDYDLSQRNQPASDSLRNAGSEFFSPPRRQLLFCFERLTRGQSFFETLLARSTRFTYASILLHRSSLKKSANLRPTSLLHQK